MQLPTKCSCNHLHFCFATFYIFILQQTNDVLKSLCETYVVTIRNMQLPNKPRVFDVTVNSKGEILRYDIQNIKGNLFIEDVEVHKQIMAALAEK